MYDPYWMRLAGVRVLTEVYVPAGPLYPALAAMPNRDQVYDIVRKEGAKVLVGYFDPGLMSGTILSPPDGVSLVATPYYALPLNLPDQSISSLPSTDPSLNTPLSQTEFLKSTLVAFK